MLIEVVVFGALGRLALGWSWPATLALVLGAMLAVRALMMAVTWFMAWRWLSPAPALAPGSVIAMVLRDLGVFVTGFCAIQPFVGAWMGPDRLRPCAMPVLLVHGYGCNRGIWWWMRRRLEADGQVVATLSLEPPWGGIDEFAAQLHARIEAVCAATGAPRVLLVAHSMGGLVSRACMARHGAARVAGLVTIATPHGGTAIARLGLGRCARQMELKSSWVSDLSGRRVTVPFVSIRTPQDNFVMPQDTQRHPDAVDEPLPGVGHMAALFDRRALTLVQRHLARMAAPG
jgi:triacylglycerol lipase